MNQITDQTRGSVQSGAFSSDAARVLVAVAEHMATTSPDDALEQHSLLVCVGAEAYRLTDRSITGGGQRLAREALDAAPLLNEYPEGITRGNYAVCLLRLVEAAGHEWGEDDNARVIPVIPGPRTEPAPADRPRIPAQPKEGER